MSFFPSCLLIATWDAIGYFDGRTDRVYSCVHNDYNVLCICVHIWACKNIACGHIRFAYFFKLSPNFLHHHAMAMLFQLLLNILLQLTECNNSISALKYYLGVVCAHTPGPVTYNCTIKTVCPYCSVNRNLKQSNTT